MRPFVKVSLVGSELGRDGGSTVVRARTRSRARLAGEALVAAVYATPSSGQAKTPIDAAEQWLETREGRQRYRVAIGLDESTLQRFERGVALLAPLLTALLTTLVPDLQL